MEKWTSCVAKASIIRSASCMQYHMINTIHLTSKLSDEKKSAGYKRWSVLTYFSMTIYTNNRSKQSSILYQTIDAVPRIWIIPSTTVSLLANKRHYLMFALTRNIGIRNNNLFQWSNKESQDKNHTLYEWVLKQVAFECNMCSSTTRKYVSSIFSYMMVLTTLILKRQADIDHTLMSLQPGSLFIHEIT
jgi:hypothetical protein